MCALNGWSGKRALCAQKGAAYERSMACSHSFGSSGLSQGVRILGSAKRTVPNEGYVGTAFPAFRPVTCPCRHNRTFGGANRTFGLIGHGPALAFRLSGNAVALWTEPLGLWRVHFCGGFAAISQPAASSAPPRQLAGRSTRRPLHGSA